MQLYGTHSFIYISSLLADRMCFNIMCILMVLIKYFTQL